ncbi:ClpP/crotonase-like domain containing protein [Rhypophila decipiens]
MSPATDLKIPSSYQTLPLKEITISHVPASSATATKVVILSFNRPHKFNAVTDTTLSEIELAYSYFSIDPRVRAIILTGTGKAFCAGADLEVGFGGIAAYKTNESTKQAYRDRGGQVALAISRCVKPTIAAINGPAAGFGLTITLPATIRVASATAKVAMPFSRRGVVMESCAAFYLPRLVGLSKAMHIFTTGQTFPVTDPLVSELFSKILPTPEDTVKYAVELATEIAENTSLASTKLMRDMMLYGADTPEGAHLLDSRVFVELVGGRDNEEGVKSFMEKRKAEFVDGARGEEDIKKVVGGFWPWWDDKTENWDGGKRGLAKL